jgi:hypothetical protein
MRNVTLCDMCILFVVSGIECETLLCFVNVASALRMRKVSRFLVFCY